MIYGPGGGHYGPMQQDTTRVDDPARQGGGLRAAILRLLQRMSGVEDEQTAALHEAMKGYKPGSGQRDTTAAEMPRWMYQPKARKTTEEPAPADTTTHRSLAQKILDLFRQPPDTVR